MVNQTSKSTGLVKSKHNEIIWNHAVRSLHVYWVSILYTRISQVLQCLIFCSRLLQLLFLTYTHWQQIQVRMRSGHAMYVTCPKHRLCQTEIMFARCGQRSISCCSWSTCATVCKETYMENSRKNDGEIWRSDTFSRFRSWKIDEYGTFAESFAAIWSSSSNSSILLQLVPRPTCFPSLPHFSLRIEKRYAARPSAFGTP